MRRHLLVVKWIITRHYGCRVPGSSPGWEATYLLVVERNHTTLRRWNPGIEARRAGHAGEVALGRRVLGTDEMTGSNPVTSSRGVTADEA